MQRNKIIQILKQKNSDKYLLPHLVPLLNYYRKNIKVKRKFSNACKIAYNSITFPIGPHISRKNILYMSKKINDLIDK